MREKVVRTRVKERHDEAEYFDRKNCDAQGDHETSSKRVSLKR